MCAEPGIQERLRQTLEACGAENRTAYVGLLGGSAAAAESASAMAAAFAVTEQHLREHFADCGAIDEIRIYRDSSAGKAFGFLTCAAPSPPPDARLSADLLQRSTLRPQPLTPIRASASVSDLKEETRACD